jgi:hypothetical protein
VFPSKAGPAVVTAFDLCELGQQRHGISPEVQARASVQSRSPHSG